MSLMSGQEGPVDNTFLLKKVMTGAEQVASHYLNQWCQSYLTSYGITLLQGVKYQLWSGDVPEIW